MKGIELRTFSLPKTGKEGTSQDAYAAVPDRGRFAIADGVSRSYHPEYVAQSLCRIFANENCSIEQWISKFDSEVLPAVSAEWAESTARAEEAMRTNPSAERYIRGWRSNLPMGSSTFAGAVIDIASKTLSYCVLGDSVLFVIPRDAPYSAFSTAKRSANGLIEFDNSPQCVSNSAPNSVGSPKLVRYGEWGAGTLPLLPGFVALLTDGAAKWLQTALTAGSESVERVWRMTAPGEFEAFANFLRESGEMDDDITILLIKIDAREELPEQDSPLYRIEGVYPFYVDPDNPNFML